MDELKRGREEREKDGEEEINVLDHLVFPAVMEHLGNKEKLCGKGNGTSSVLTRGLGVKIGRGKVRVPSWFSISA